MKTIIWYTSIIFLCSCSIKKVVEGKYMSNSNSNYIELRKDSSFIYEYRSLHSYQHSIGKWKRISNNRVELNSEFESTNLTNSVIKKSRIESYDNIITLNLNINGNKSLADYTCKVYVNDSVYFIRRCDSLSSILVTKPLTNFYLMFIRTPRTVSTTYVSLPLTTNKIYSEFNIGNRFEVNLTINDMFFYYRSFKYENIEMKSNSLRMFNSSKKRWQKLTKVSDSTNIFSRYDNGSKGLNVFE